MGKAKILAFAGSVRKGSWNHRLVQEAARVAESAGADVTVIHLSDFPLPLFDQDLEAENGMPQEAVRLKEIFANHNGLLLSCPEYNSSITPLLKNVIDWVSRPATQDESPLSSYAGKTAGLMAASPGGFGGLRGLRHVREILGNIGVLVTPKQFALGSAHSAFDEEGKLVDAKQASMLKACVEQLVKTCANQDLE